MRAWAMSCRSMFVGLGDDRRAGDCWHPERLNWSREPHRIHRRRVRLRGLAMPHAPGRAIMAGLPRTAPPAQPIGRRLARRQRGGKRQVAAPPVPKTGPAPLRPKPTSPTVTAKPAPRSPPPRPAVSPARWPAPAPRIAPKPPAKAGPPPAPKPPPAPAPAGKSAVFGKPPRPR